jgi:polyhydroxyalkanoate synthesis regulator phasin
MIDRPKRLEDGYNVCKVFYMSTSMRQAFFVGRALATTLREQVEQLATEGLSNLGRFDAQQRETLRQFTEDVLNRAQQDEGATAPAGSGTASGSDGDNREDLQATIDNLRAEIAQVRFTLQQYRSKE